MQDRDILWSILYMDWASSELKTWHDLFQGKAASIILDYFLYRLWRKDLSQQQKKQSYLLVGNIKTAEQN